MHSVKTDGDGKSMGQPANPGSTGKMDMCMSLFNMLQVTSSNAKCLQRVASKQKMQRKS